ncbi:hypothetical protein LV89_04759 [Arcicella aurantiaca]|uniref:Transmembrane protein n=1 Tax=Arcicella aurantiaca TaxID=591202 RepID=A0A316DF10_9BACT|nr:hypothetical protein [Arcicella aurantiaca]PWK16801.1 hypothetical protein LV89_04759 [Arcicella aurantiaca]
MIKCIKIIFWLSIVFALLFTMYLKQSYLFTKVLFDYVGTQALWASWALAIITEFIRGAFAYASFLASEKGLSQTKTIALLVSVGISLFDFWEVYHYLDTQAIAYTAYFFVSITLALELMGGAILQEINEMSYRELESSEEENCSESLIKNNQIQSPFVDLIDSFPNANNLAQINPMLEEMSCFTKKRNDRTVRVKSTLKSVRHGTLFLF